MAFVDDDVTVIDYSGIQTTTQRTYSRSAGVTASSRAFTSVEGGTLRFGYRDVNSGNKTDRYVITASSFYSYIERARLNCISIGGTDMKIKILQDRTVSNLKLITKLGTTFLPTGHLQVITSITKSQKNGVKWTIEKLPFQNGLCVARR